MVGGGSHSLRLKPSIPPQAPLPPRVRSTLEAIPWCNRILQDPNVKAFLTPNRIPKPLTTEDALVAQTLATEDALPIFQAFHRSPSPNRPSGEFLFIFSLQPGLNGHAHIVHGGMIAVLMDEIMGHAAFYTRSPVRMSYTASITVDFKKPLETPRVVLGRSWLEETRSHGRKMWARAVLEDGEGTAFAEGRSLYVETKEAKVKL